MSLLKKSAIISLLTLTPSGSLSVSPELLWPIPREETLDFCKESLEKAVKDSPEELFIESFDKVNKLKKTADRNYQDLKNSFLLLCNIDKTAAKKQQLPLIGIKSTACQDLRVLSNNPGSGLKSVFQILFGVQGIAPLHTPEGIVKAMGALAHPESDLEKLNSRRAQIEFLINNPKLVANLDALLSELSSHQANS